VPSLSLNVTVTTGGMLRALVVDWESLGGIITTYIVTYDDFTISTNGNDTMYTIMGLDPFTVYTIRVTACTDIGCGNQTDVGIGTTAEEGAVCTVQHMYIHMFNRIFSHEKNKIKFSDLFMLSTWLQQYVVTLCLCTVCMLVCVSVPT